MMIIGGLSFNFFNITLVIMLLGILNALKYAKSKNRGLLEENGMRENEFLLLWMLFGFYIFIIMMQTGRFYGAIHFEDGEKMPFILSFLGLIELTFCFGYILVIFFL